MRAIDQLHLHRSSKKSHQVEWQVAISLIVSFLLHLPFFFQFDVVECNSDRMDDYEEYEEGIILIFSHK